MRETRTNISFHVGNDCENTIDEVVNTPVLELKSDHSKIEMFFNSWQQLRNLSDFIHIQLLAHESEMLEKTYQAAERLEKTYQAAKDAGMVISEGGLNITDDEGNDENAKKK